MSLFSVVIPTRNRVALLAETLASVWAQSDGGAEVIVVDDGSTDGTGDYLASLGDRITLVQLDGRGAGAARNAGAQRATRDYLAFLDSDDLWLPWTLATFAALAARYDRPALMCASWKRFRDGAELADERETPVVAEAFADYLATWPRQISVAGGMIVVRRDEFERVGGFTPQPRNLEDHDLVLRLGTARGFIRLLQPLTVGWRLHEGSLTFDLGKSVDGCRMLLNHERDGRYPGGPDRLRSRLDLIAADIRSVSIECARAGRTRDAAQLYAATAGWHVGLNRWKYLVAFPLVIGLSALRSRVVVRDTAASR